MNPHTAAQILRNHNDWRRGFIEQSKYTPRAIMHIIETFAPDNDILIAYVNYIREGGVFSVPNHVIGKEIDKLIVRLLEE